MRKVPETSPAILNEDQLETGWENKEKTRGEKKGSDLEKGEGVDREGGKEGRRSKRRLK